MSSTNAVKSDHLGRGHGDEVRRIELGLDNLRDCVRLGARELGGLQARVAQVEDEPMRAAVVLVLLLLLHGHGGESPRG